MNLRRPRPLVGNLHHPFWVKSQWRNAGHPQVTSAPCPLCPQHQTFTAELRRSVLCHEPTRQGKVEATVKCPQGRSAVVDRIGLFQLGVGAFASGRRATKILDVHSSAVSRLWLRNRTRVKTITLSG